MGNSTVIVFQLARRQHCPRNRKTLVRLAKSKIPSAVLHTLHSQRSKLVRLALLYFSLAVLLYIYDNHIFTFNEKACPNF